GYQVQRQNGYYLVFNPEADGPKFTSVAQTVRFTVRHLPAATACSLLPETLQPFVRVDDTADVLVVTAPLVQLARIEDDLAKIDVPAASDTVFVPLDYATAPAAVALLPAPLRRFVRADAERNTL